MTNALSKNQIAQIKATEAAGDISSAYDALSNQGYGYAGWAGGVARGDTIAGVAAVDYLKGTALMGVGASSCQTLGDEKILAIKTGMADGYLRTLDKIADTLGNNGMVSRDISADEVLQIHTEVFQKNGLSIDNWTLNAPFTIIRKLEGDEGVERYWEFMRDTKGADSYDGIVANLATLAFMHKQTLSADPEIRGLAEKWMQDVPGIYDWNQIDRSLHVALAVASVKTRSRLRELADLLDEQDVGGVIADIQSKFQQAEVTRSPLILDLDGDGVETIGKSAGIHFDHDGNGFAETTGWAGKDDGLLVWDRNGNGKIDDGSELFGNKTRLADGSNADNGFAALAELDSNHDGAVDVLDAEFSQLRVWKATDGNATMSDGELLGLDEAGVQSIKVAYVQQSVTDTQGNQHLQIGQYMRADGSARDIDDVWFAADMARTTDLNTVVIADDIKALPDLQGFGNVHSLHQAMALDLTGKLQALVIQFTNEPDAATRASLIKDLIYTWAGVENIDPASRAATQIYGNVIGDARKLATLEAFLGEGYLGTWCWGTRDSNPHGQAAPILLQAFDQLEARFSSQLMAQSQFKDLYDSVGLTLDADTFAISLDVGKTLDKLSALYEANLDQATARIKEFVSSLKANGDFGTQVITALRAHGDLNGTGFSQLLAVMGAKYVLGDGGDNIMMADFEQAAIFIGMDGDDRLVGNNREDSLAGGTGNDLLNGGVGNDTYVFARGDGADLFTDYDTTAGNTDVAQFKDVASTEVTSIERDGNDLVMKYAEADKLTVQGYFDPNYPGYRIERFNFSDGVNWDDAAIRGQAITNGSAGYDYIVGYDDGTNRIYGLDGNDYLLGGAKDDFVDGGTGNDTLNGRAGDDMLVGGAGDDQINGGEGNDILVGGTGNDSLCDRKGNDTYVLARGDGVDIIDDYDTTAGNTDVAQFTNVASTEVTSVERQGSELVLKYGESDQLTVIDYFNPNYPGSRVEQFSFSDGVSWDEAAIKARVITNGRASNDYIVGYTDGSNRIFGFDGNDYLLGGSGADMIDGGAGNDILYGYAGNDILQGAAGLDRLDDTVGNNVFNGGADDDVLNGGSGNELYIGGAGNDVITTGLGYDLIAFNRGDGQDTVAASTGRDNTLSLGGGIAYADLSLSRSADNLVLATGVDESITFTDWYANLSNHSVANLQMVVEGGSDYDAASPDSLLNEKIAQFDFDAMVSRFDAAQATSPGLSSWALSSAMLDFHLGSSDTAAIGGDLAYQYGRVGELSSMSVNAAQSLLAGAQFGASNQALQGGATLQDLSPRLM